ncbi:hydroxymethylbilane synthase [Campylobacter hepaticus]|uniref:Porphobilinogen deaminase n=1 Tax=Campylobacter hepaticus TaxID=1813019 RepID=A0A6A7JT03_9BACT|nr:hydroxymethylbilane synthase [Campylobacter hepaticus]AXP08942.1 hydroxymethylbilane synthase [Campylobacter hepaticus]MPV54588.1 hydroxymethylbilane synthase [Campylobacter hepaticus]MPV62603.1 hydroxymethylbilane synthase [Campylobacter hepaticus]MPV77271.1 hydroxymethylbilane synthase [Campylobacter hepaticus]MPV78868.1 hydroxymethylbilane synthase [Campylobacter hepaticus]
MKELIIATRKSQLALWQSHHIAQILKDKHQIEVVLEGFKTKGDVLLDTPLAKIGGKGLFTKELEESMLRKDAHLAVHSLKDMPSFFPQGLVLAAVSKREKSNDAMLSQNYKDFLSLPQGAKIGTTSLRRKMQLLLLRPDLKIISLRGNVNSRIQKLKNGEFDAIILAIAGIKRLNLDKEVNFVYEFSKDELIPAASQGALGIQSIDQSDILELLECLNDEDALIETTIERDFIATLEGGCQVPIGVNAELLNDKICVRCVLGLPDGSEILKDKRMIKKSDYKFFGEKLAKEFIAKGAKELLIQAESMI